MIDEKPKTLDMINYESPLKPKSFWQKSKKIIFSSIACLSVFLSYCGYNNFSYQQKRDSLCSSYLSSSYVSVKESCKDLGDERIVLNFGVDKISKEDLSRTEIAASLLEKGVQSEKESRKIKLGVELILFQETPQNIIRQAKYVGSYSAQIDSLLLAVDSGVLLKEIEQSANNQSISLSMEEKAFLLKVMVEYSGDSQISVEEKDYPLYYEKKAESALFLASNKKNPQSTQYIAQNYYIQSINSLTDIVLIGDGSSGQSNNYESIKIQELTLKLNNLPKYISVLQNVNTKKI